MGRKPLSGVYSFLNVTAAIAGKGGSFPLSTAGVAEGGIRVSMNGDKNRMTIGAAGDGMHSLIANNSGRLTVSILKTLPGNKLLNDMYRFQKTSAAYWGQNVITLTNIISGDTITATSCAFSKHPDLIYSSEAGMMEWPFDCVDIDEILGNFYQVAAA